MPWSPLSVSPGTILRGKYRVDALIGRGGMGRVFRAFDLENGGEVALKIVSKVGIEAPVMKRLHREAEAATRIHSEYVPPVVDVGETVDGEIFLAMQLLVGESLLDRLRNRSLPAWEEVAQIGEEVLRGLIDAHTAGVVHRDLKPSNVFLARTGEDGGRVRAMILDFGVCKMDAPETEHLTIAGEALGTVGYMAPEQIRCAADVDDRADLYAFGVMVFEMLAGRLPHDGATQTAILASRLEQPAARLRDHARTRIPEGLDELVARALERDPNERFASAQELLRAWRAIRAGLITDSLPPRSTRPRMTFELPPAPVPLLDAGADAARNAAKAPRSGAGVWGVVGVGASLLFAGAAVAAAWGASTADVPRAAGNAALRVPDPSAPHVGLELAERHAAMVGSTEPSASSVMSAPSVTADPNTSKAPAVIAPAEPKAAADASVDGDGARKPRGPAARSSAAPSAFGPRITEQPRY